MTIGSWHTRSCKFVLALVLVGLPLTFVPSANAAPGSGTPAKPGKNSVIELFDTANKLFADKKYDAALLLFREAYEQTQSPNAHLMIGKCLLAQNKLREAYDELSATLLEAGKRAETEAKYANTRDAAATELAPLERKIGKIVVTLVDAPADAHVRVGNVELAKDKLGTPVAVMPGTIEIVAEGLAQGTVTKHEEIKGGETKVVVFSPDAQTRTQNTPPTTNPVPDATTGGGVRKAGFAVLGLGAVGMGLFAIGGIQGNAKFATLEKECGTTRCTDPKYADIVDSGKNLDLVANIGLGVGIAGIVAGTVMVIVGGPKPKPKTTDASFFIAPGQTMLQLRHVF